MSYKDRLPEHLHGVYEEGRREHQKRKMGCGWILVIIVAAIIPIIHRFEI